MSSPSNHNRNPRRLALLAAREAYWKAQFSGAIWSKLYIQRRGCRPLPKGFRIRDEEVLMVAAAAKRAWLRRHPATVKFVPMPTEADVMATLHRKAMITTNEVRRTFALPPLEQ